MGNVASAAFWGVFDNTTLECVDDILWIKWTHFLRAKMGIILLTLSSGRPDFLQGFEVYCELQLPLDGGARRVPTLARFEMNSNSLFRVQTAWDSIGEGAKTRKKPEIASHWQAVLKLRGSGFPNTRFLCCRLVSSKGNGLRDWGGIDGYIDR